MAPRARLRESVSIESASNSGNLRPWSLFGRLTCIYVASFGTSSALSDQSPKRGLNYRLPATTLRIFDNLRDQGSLRLRLTVACPAGKNVIVA